MLSTVDLGEFSPPRRDNKLEQLTDVRNFARRELKLHPGSDSVSIYVNWQDESSEKLVFDQYVGYPEGTTSSQWLEQWKMETNR